MGGTSDIEVEKLEHKPFIKRSVTTGAGNVGGTTLVDSALIEANDYWNGMALLIRTGTYAGRIRRVLDFDAATDTITLDYTVGGQIATGIRYVMFFPTLLPATIVAPIPLPTDPIDRVARLLGIVYGNLAQLQQKAGTFELLVEDTGLNTNPRRYEKNNGFRSPIVTRAGGVATALWTIVTVPARTAGRVSTIYTLIIENATGATVTGWLEIGGVAITPPYHVANNDSVVIDFIAGLNSGNNDVNCNASANGVVFQIVGTEA